jgi:hypothetical protein
MDRAEQLIVESLARKAAEAPPGQELLAVVHQRLRRRRTGRAVGAVVLATAAVAAAVTASHSVGEPRTEPPTAAQAPAPGWRWESYRSVEVQVPEEWTQYVLGLAPCTPAAAPAVGRVGGWISRSWYTCSTAVQPLDRRRPYLWFDDVQAPGVKHYDGGWTEETRVVGGVKLSVLTADDGLRKQILDSARQIRGTDYYGCAATEPAPSAGAAGGVVTSADICEYWKGSLVAGSALTGAPAAQLGRQLNGFQPRTPQPAPGCQDTRPRDYLITLHSSGRSWQVRVSYSTCDVSYWPPGLDLIQTAAHRFFQPDDLFDPATPVTTLPR